MFASFGKRCVKYAIAHKLHIHAVELAAAFMVWRGIADWSFPASLIVAGVAVIAVIEMRG